MNSDKTFENIQAPKALNEITFHNLMLSIYEDKWFIITIALLIFLISAVFLLRKPELYESNVLIQVENRAENLGELNLPKMFDSKASPSDVQKALLISRFVLEPVVEKLNLNISVEPVYFPIIGSIIAKHYSGAPVAKPWMGLKHFNWGGEKIKVSYLEVSHDYLGKNLILKNDNNGYYRLYDQNHYLILTGKVGNWVKVKNTNGEVTILISSLSANKGATFIIQKSFTSQIVQALQNKLSISEMGSSDRMNLKTGILQLSLTGPKPQQLALTLNTIAHTALQADDENQLMEAKKTLDFLNQQLPEVKKSLTQAEAELNNYRAQSGRLNLTAETQIMLSEIANIEKQIGETRLKKKELLQYNTSAHPFVLELNAREQQLSQELNRLQAGIKKMPAEDQITLSLAREVRVKSQLYLLLAKKMQELQVISAGTMSDVRILSPAKIADFPLPNRKILKLIILFLFGCMMGGVIALTRRALFRKIHDPLWTEQNLGIITAAIIPYSKKQNSHDRMEKKGLIQKYSILAAGASHDLAVEALRSLRTHFLVSLQGSPNNIVSIIGISPKVGKSFIASNFAYLLADAGKKVLLIDADIRRGHLYRYFNLNKSPGLYELITGKVDLENALQRIPNMSLHFLSTGSYYAKTSELLMTEKFTQFLRQVANFYDVVVIDTAPVLAITDGVIVAKHAGTNYLAVGSKMHYAEEIEFTIKRLYANNIKINGIIYNQINHENGIYSYGNYRYKYYYNYEKAG